MAPKSKSRIYNTSQKPSRPTTTNTTTTLKAKNTTPSPQQQPEPISIADRLQKYNSTIGHGSYAAENEEKLMMTKLFSIRSAHLPGNNWCQDWFQWMQNNHPLLGLCCRHHLNPIGSLPRSILLISSACYGLIATNMVYLFYRSNEERNGSIGAITYERIVLFTVGGVFHSLADLCMWHLTACACCLPDFGNKQKTLGFLGKVGPFVAVAVAAIMVALATFVVMMRLDHEEEMRGAAAAEGGGGDGAGGEGEETTVNSFRFLISWLMELGTVYLVWHPLLSTFFFTGLIWPIFPCIGGRPKELKRQADEANQNNISAKKSVKSAFPIPIV